MKNKIIYYTDELNDEFSDATINCITIDENYKYYHNSKWKKITHFFWYRMIATPIVWLSLKIKFHHKIVNKKILKEFKKDAYFMYANHTHQYADVGIPSMVSIPKDTYIIVNKANVSIPIIGKITPSLGAIPLPDTLKASKNFMDCIKKRVNEKKCIMIYPEAHIWPYYTKIRPFSDQSFRYPIQFDKPSFCFTNVYCKKKFGKSPKIVTYVDGPFFPDRSLSIHEQRKKLRDEIYNQMVLRSKLNEVEVITYIKKEG